MKISLNTPVSLLFVLICFILTGISAIIPLDFLAASASISLFSPAFYLGLVGHVFLHAGWSHLLGNMMLFLLVAPSVEERYSGFTLSAFIVVTSVLIALTNAILLSTALIGASGIVFGLILLNSYANKKQGTIPVTTIIVALLYLGNELVHISAADNVSQWAHLFQK